MAFHSLYRSTAEIYLLVKAVLTPALCILGWLLLGRAVSKKLRSFIYWFLPSMIGASFGAIGLLLETFLSFYDRRDYEMVLVVYFLYLIGIPFHIVSFIRLWKTITNLPFGSDEPSPLKSMEQDAGVWPPQPRR